MRTACASCVCLLVCVFLQHVETLLSPRCSGTISFTPPETTEEETEAAPEEEDPDAPPNPLRGTKNGLIDQCTWTHYFTFTATINEDTAVMLCKTIESSVNLMKADLDVPLVALPLDFAPLVAGDKDMDTGVSLAATELLQNPYNLAEFSIKTTVFERSRPFLTPALEAKLNPLCITIVAAEDMPDHREYQPNGTWKEGLNPRTQTLQQLADHCKPVFCKYTFMPPPPGGPPTAESGEGEDATLPDWSKEVVTHGVTQARKVKFMHKKVFMAGLMHPDDLFQHLRDNTLEIEVHDREKIVIPNECSETQTEDEEGGGAPPPPPVWSGLKSIDKARAEEKLPRDPFAVGSLNLFPLCDGRRFLVERCNLWPKRVKYPDFSAYEKPLTGDYVDCGSVLIVKIDLCRPLRITTLYPSGPFQRVVYRFEYGNADLLEQLSESIVRINADALGQRKERPKPDILQSQPQTPRDRKAYEQARADYEADRFEPPLNDMISRMLQEGSSLDMLEKTLNGVELTKEQAQDSTIDVITGVQVIDSNFRIFVLEGLKDKGILRLLKENPRISRNTKEFKMLYNPEITFAERLYGEKYHVNIKKIKLRETLRQLILKVDTYLEPKYQLTAFALMRLNEIAKAGRMKKLRDLVLFPEVKQLEHMYKKLGDALSVEDLTGRKPVQKKKKSEEHEMPALTKEELAAATSMPRPKFKPPTDCVNPVYLQFLQTKPPPADFVSQNIEEVRGEALQKKPEAMLEFGEVYNYAGQYLQYFDMQMDFAKQRYMQDFGKVHYTYSKDLLSGAFVLCDPEKEAKREKKASKALWRTQEGFQWPKARTPHEINKYPVKLPSAGYEVIETEWVENEFSTQPDGRIPKFEPTEGRKNFNPITQKISLAFEKDPAFLKSVFAAESGAALEEQERKTQTYNSWANRLQVNDKRFHVLWNGGKSQIDRQKPLLKNLPVKGTLQALANPDGCQPGKEYPPSMFARDQYIDPIQTYIVDTYGVRLRFEEQSVDNETRVTRWIQPMAPGVKVDKEKPAMHSADFQGNSRQKATAIPHEKLSYKPIAALKNDEKDRPAALYAHTYQRMAD